MNSSKRQNERGIAVAVSCIILVLAIPMMGLAIDGTVLYVAKSRLQGAVDGAALAATKALARGTDDASQLNNAKIAAATYVMLNYPSNFFFTSSVTVNQATDISIDETVAQQRTVTVTGHVVVPTLFMRWFNAPSTTVTASTTTVRRDVNIVLVVDRSGSLASSGSCDPLKQSAVNFVNKFSNGRDNIGVVTFASSTHVDFPIANNFQTASPNAVSILGSLNCTGSTSTAMGLWEGYDQLVGLNQGGALNIMLFFTDGQPTGTNVNMPLISSPYCTNAHAGTPKWVNGVYNTFANSNGFFGILRPTNSGLPVTNYDLNATLDSNKGAGCHYMNGWVDGDNSVHNMTDISDFQGMPLHDVFGDNLDNGFQNVSYAGSYISLSNTNNAPAVPLNAADDAAYQIRRGNNLCANASPLSSCTGVLTHTGHINKVLIYSIGLGTNVTVLSPDFLRRVSNDPASSSYDSNYPSGAYIPAPTSADIDAAFALVASEILRIAK